jgi:hypothetical protein
VSISLRQRFRIKRFRVGYLTSGRLKQCELMRDREAALAAVAIHEQCQRLDLDCFAALAMTTASRLNRAAG